MTVEKRALKKDSTERAGLASLFGVFRSKEKPEVEPETVTVKEETKKIKRVVKLGPKGMKHGSEAFKPEPMTEEDIKITEQVFDGIAPTNDAPAPKDEDTFPCVECGAAVPKTADRCPRCHAHYIQDVADEDLDMGPEGDEVHLTEDAEEFLNKEGVPCIHFDAETGTISYLENDDSEPDFMLECTHCGTAIQFDTDRCPICGTKLDPVDTGIVGLFSDMKFDDENSKDMDCPSCGEKVTLVNGKCPECGEIVRDWDAVEVVEKVDPVIHTDNVVFLHLDVESGELNYLQKLAKKLGFEQLTVHLDGIGKDRFDQDWKSLSRI
jgi:hypothetical protein